MTNQLMLDLIEASADNAATDVGMYLHKQKLEIEEFEDKKYTLLLKISELLMKWGE